MNGVTKSFAVVGNRRGQVGVTGVTQLCTDARIRPVLVVDGAHHLRADVLEDLGQTELRRRLTVAVHEALAQRVVLRYHLTALTRDELPAYLTHRLQLAGATVPLFDPTAEEAHYQATSGLPRKINLLAHHTLMGRDPRDSEGRHGGSSPGRAP